MMRFPLRLSSTLLASVVFAAAFSMLGATAATAQVSLTQMPNLPTTLVLNRSSCLEENDDQRLQLRWIFSGDEPTYDIIFRSFVGTELPSNNCPLLTNTNVDGDDILSSPFQAVPNGQNEMDIQFSVFPRELTTDDICDDDGLRDTQRTLCIYVTDANSGLEEYRTTVGTGISVDTETPDVVELPAVVGGDGRFTAIPSAPSPVSGETLRFEVQYRRCAAAGVDAGTLRDGGVKRGDRIDDDSAQNGKGEDLGDDVAKMDDGGVHDGGLDDAGASDAGVNDAGASDAGASDAGASDAGASDAGASDAGATDGGGVTNDAGVTEPDGDITGPTNCGATTNYRVLTQDGSEIVVTGLLNGSEYEVRVRAIDDFGNAGRFSTRQYITPISEVGFMSLYEGGEDPLGFDPTEFIEDLTSGDGCSSRMVTGGGTPWSALALLGFGIFFIFGRPRRQRRRLPNGKLKTTAARTSISAMLVVLFSLMSTSARADFGDVTLQASVGPYTPNLDAGASFPAYGCLYKNSLIIPRFDVDVGLHLFDDFGSVQANLGFGFLQSRGKAQPVGGPSLNPYTGLRDCQPTSDTAAQVELTMLTLRPGLTYRADQLLDYLNIPLVPYIRAGFLVTGYAFTKTGLYDNARAASGVNPAGVRLGAEGALGLMLALDWWDYISVFSRNTTKRAQALDVFQHAFFYGEVGAQDLNTFGAPGPNLTHVDYLFGTGLPLFVNLGVAMEF